MKMAGEPWYPIDLVKLRTALLLILLSDLELVKLKLVHHAVLKGWPNITNFSELKKNLEPTLNLLVKTSGDLCKKEKNTNALSNNYVKKSKDFFFGKDITSDISKTLMNISMS